MPLLRFKTDTARESFRVEYPFESNYFSLPAMRMHYLDEGDGPPVVMVHGNPTWSYYYRNLIKELRGDYRCIAPDHIGCGLSDVPDDSGYEYTLASRVDDLERLIDSLSLGNEITLVLHDWGGMIGMAYADRHPERIKRIVILNTAAFPLPASKPFPWPLWFARTRLGEFCVLRFNAFSRIAAELCCSRKKLTPEVKQGYAAPYEDPARRIATLRFVQDIPLNPEDKAYEIVLGVASRLDQFSKTPALICWGLKDFVFDKHFLAEWKKYWPHAEVHEYPDCHHYILEDAFEEIAPLIRKFMQKK